ncbi:hypothetical protein NDU88_004406 [Pleurodeles waltl]|uniref:Uncharacterized protein n=1 Tax=Pleurodeles waltl TaxID=8319 RepID=A0AAV7WV06_PLEWA|nr:hypothetical protein NDU88_004406 [Pleurodeles waltl]
MAAHVTPLSSVAQLADSYPADATDRILQEITALGRCQEAMDLKILEISAASTSILVDICHFQVTVTDHDHRLTTVEDHIADLPGRDMEIRSLQTKITDLEDRSRRDYVRFFGIPEHKSGGWLPHAALIPPEWMQSGNAGKCGVYGVFNLAPAAMRNREELLSGRILSDWSDTLVLMARTEAVLEIISIISVNDYATLSPVI